MRSYEYNSPIDTKGTNRDCFVNVLNSCGKLADTGSRGDKTFFQIVEDTNESLWGGTSSDCLTALTDFVLKL